MPKKKFDEKETLWEKSWKKVIKKECRDTYKGKIKMYANTKKRKNKQLVQWKVWKLNHKICAWI